MDVPDSSVTEPPLFRQPKPWIRWLAVALALAGWCVSWQLLLVSIGDKAANPFLQALCGGDEESGCNSVLTSPQAYVRIAPAPESPRIPVSAFGMAYFAFVALWYLFVGPPVRSGRAWHLLIGLVVLYGAWQSLVYIDIMKSELRQWCGGCLAAHGLNGGLLLLTLAAYPWRSAAQRAPRHPTARLALATAAAGALAGFIHLALAYVVVAGNILKERTAQFSAVLKDPEYILWDFHRQAPVSIPLYDDEIFAGDPAAPHTAVVFGDFQCSHCRQLHGILMEVAHTYPDRLRVAFRYYPQDAECNPNPRFRTGGHASACRAARAAEAARVVGGRDAYLAMRAKLWDNQAALPDRPVARQSEQERKLFEDWAAELGLARAAFTAAMESAEVTTRIRADIELAQRLDLQAMPVVYTDGRKLRNWSKLETWDVILNGPADATTQPAAAPGVRGRPEVSPPPRSACGGYGMGHLRIGPPPALRPE